MHTLHTKHSTFYYLWRFYGACHRFSLVTSVVYEFKFGFSGHRPNDEFESGSGYVGRVGIVLSVLWIRNSNSLLRRATSSPICEHEIDRVFQTKIDTLPKNTHVSTGFRLCDQIHGIASYGFESHN